MTLRLSTLFEEQIKRIFKRPASSLNRSNRTKKNARRNAGSSLTNGSRSARRTHRLSEDDDIDVVNGETPSTSKFSNCNQKFKNLT